jgi:hypothetical protein
MKAILLMVMILVAVIITSGQESKTDKTFQQKKFNTEIKSDSDEFAVNSPKSKTDTSLLIFKPNQKVPGTDLNLNNHETNPVLANKQVPELRMPVAGAGVRNYFNMPVAVPDSAVEYYIKVKWIDFVNPWENNSKSQPLIVINGKETGLTATNIDPETVHSVKVLKGEKAVEKYGRKGKNGVIEITLLKR